MRTTALAIVFLAACGSKHDRVNIAITADGYVKLDGKAVTLDELAKSLGARREAGPKEDVDHAFGVSALPVVVDPEQDAAWGHVEWVMTILAKEKFRRLSFPGGREAPLPVDVGLCPVSGPPDGKALLVRAMAASDGAYLLGNRATRDVAELGTWIDAAPHAGVLCRIAVLGAQPRAPWRQVRPLFDLLRGRGVKRIDFYGSHIPPREVRARSPLPAPDPSPRPAAWYRAWSGLTLVDYWSESDYYGEEEPVLPEDDLLEWLNLERQGSPLAADAMLGKAASLHAEEMDRLGYYGHFSPVPANHSPSDRLAKFGWPEERRHAELLAKAETAEAAFDAILKNAENAAALADPAFEYAGVARSGDCWVVLLGAQK